MMHGLSIGASRTCSVTEEFQQYGIDAPGHILVVEDNAEMGRSLAALVRLFGHTVEVVESGRRALHTVLARPPDLIILDVRLPDIDGYTVCASLKRDPLTWPIPIIMVTVEHEHDAHLRGIEVEADGYLHKPVDARELEIRLRVLVRAKRRHERMERAEDVIFALARTVEAKDAYTEGHLQRMARYAVAIAERMGLRGSELIAVQYGAFLHDVGKVGIDEIIIRKGGPLTPTEYRTMQQHAVIGARIVQPLRLSAAIGPIVRHHHERWDGHGYPDGLAGDAIPLGARIVAVADAFDAMTTQRPYNRVISFAEAVERLQAGAWIYWDARIVAVFVDWLSQTGQISA